MEHIGFGGTWLVAIGVLFGVMAVSVTIRARVFGIPWPRWPNSLLGLCVAGCAPGISVFIMGALGGEEEAGPVPWMLRDSTVAVGGIIAAVMAIAVTACWIVRATTPRDVSIDAESRLADR